MFSRATYFLMKSLSLFSGCLGLDLGLEQAGIHPIAYVENNATCQKSILANRPKALIFDDIFSDNLRGYALQHKPDVIVGGPPCQSFSTIGKRAFLNDPRGQCLLRFVQLVQSIRPSFFVMENVQGIVSPACKDIICEVEDAFHRKGYRTVWGILNSADFGVPQKRLRFVMIGALNRTPTLPEGGVSRIITLRDAIGDLEHNPGAYLSFSPALQKVMPRIPEGGCWRSLPVRLRKKMMGNARLSSGGLTGYCRRLSYDKPSPTLLTSPVQRASILGHPTQNRPLSISEYRRIQCFPDDWKVEGSIQDQYRQLGNAVPVLLGKAIGVTLRKIVT